MKSWAYYNEINPFAVQWLKNAIKENVICPGEVDERSIVDVPAGDVKGFTQCHWFAGFGTWSWAARAAGIPDTQPIWTGSCPCPPFSVAGKKAACPKCHFPGIIPCPRRDAYFHCARCSHYWPYDERHLFPTWRKLIEQCRPPIVFGEQVSGTGGKAWLTVVRASLEMLGYAFGPLGISSAGVGGPNARERFYFGADLVGTPDAMRSGRNERRTGPGIGSSAGGRGEVCGIPHSEGQRRHGREEGAGQAGRPVTQGGGRLANPYSEHEREREETGRTREPGRPGEISGVGDAIGQGPQGHAGHGEASQGAEREAAETGFGSNTAPGVQDGGGLVNGYWRNWEFRPCSDGKHRPIEPELQPTVTSYPGLTMELSAIGNAINAEAAKEFIGAYLDTGRR